MSRPFYQATITALLALGYAAGCNGTHSGNPVDGEPEVRIRNPLKKISKVDILFVMDNSGSMKEEQDAVQRLVEVLVTGDRDNDGEPEFEPADSLHLGVVSTDLGLPEIEKSPDPEGKCLGIGDDGLLQHEGEQPSPCGNGTIDDGEECDGDDLGGETCESLGFGEGELVCNPLLCTLNTCNCSEGPDPLCNLNADNYSEGPEAPGLAYVPDESSGPECEESYPLFLEHEPDTGNAGQTAEDFTCMLQLGISGCGFEQPLEAGLKALWPSADDSVTFFGPSAFGHGDAENAGFLREDSLLAVIVVTDEEDCSAQDIHIFEHQLTAEPEIAEQPANLRCFYNPDRLYPIERYVDNLKALRPGMEDRIIFGLIAGVPPELVNSESDLPAHILGKVEADPAELEAYYQQILDAPEMRQKIRADRQNLEPSCTVENPLYDPYDLFGKHEQYFTKAYPPRRLVQVARGFGVNGVVQSICDESFLSPIETLILAVTNRIIEAEQQAEQSER